jgi:1-hydroxycarotenoid 3,4-desaturase
MYRLAAALSDLAIRRGVHFRYLTEISEIIVQSGRVAGVRLASGERIEASNVVSTIDVAALAQALLGRDAARAASPIPDKARSLSAMTWSCLARTSGFPLLRHSVFFSNNYRDEFDSIFGRHEMSRQPTVYVCAQDRDDSADGINSKERLFILVNAPAIGDRRRFEPAEISQCARQTFGMLEQCGLDIHVEPELTRVTTPTDFNRMFPGTGGALYGRSSHGWMASFQRPGAKTKLPGLYLAGGSAHPGPGVPMAALSGQMAAKSLIEDLASAGSLQRMAMRGGTSMR